MALLCIPLQEYPEPDNSKLYVDLQLIWLAAALRCPAKLACDLGHQAMVAQLSVEPDLPGYSLACAGLALNAAGILQGLRWDRLGYIYSFICLHLPS